MVQAVEAYRHVSATDEFLEFERIREKARLNEASALARRDEIWEEKMAKKDAAHTTEMAKRDTVIAAREAEIAELRSTLPVFGRRHTIEL